MSDSWKLFWWGLGIATVASIPYAISQVIANGRQKKVNEEYVEKNKK